MRRVFVTGIGTEVGKTVVAAILVEALSADYWKPIQAGDLERSDSKVVSSLIRSGGERVHPEAYRLTQPMSPHAAADRDGVRIDVGRISLPKTSKVLVIEGAGGLCVPLNSSDLMIDLIKQLEAEVVLVSRNYLGSINHTLLSIEALQHREIPLSGIVFNGPATPTSEEVICERSGIPVIGRVSNEPKIDGTVIKRYAEVFREKLEFLV